MNLNRKYAACAAQIQRYSERIKFVHYKLRRGLGNSKNAQNFCARVMTKASKFAIKRSQNRTRHHHSHPCSVMVKKYIHVLFALCDTAH